MVAGRRSVTLLFFLAFAAVLAACSAAAPPPGTAQSDELRQTIESEVSATLEAAGALEIGSVQATPLAPLSGTLSAAGVITDRQPQPTATPDVLTRAIDSAAAGTPLDTLTLFGLDGADWINLAVAILIVIAAYIIGSALSRLAVRWLTPRLEDDRAKEILQRIGRLVRWLIVVFILNFNVVRLQFLSVGLKIMLANLLYVAGLLLTATILWLAVDLIVAETRFRLASEQRAEELAPAILLAHRGAHVILALVFLTILLAHFGINITALAALLGIGGLAISLAARDTVADAIAGIQILIDRPFRVGDRIEVSAANTWGDVVEVGLRTTRIRTRDNRMVIIPNNLIAQNQVINYSYPDPTYRIETDIDIAYGSDIEKARQVMHDAVRQVPTVLRDKPVDVLYNEMGDFAMVFRVRWWIQTYADTRRVTDQVHTALQEALDEAGIYSPYPTQTVRLHEGKADKGS